jgi:RNA polymerase sigma-70 factor (ECF subfamily)
MNASLMAEVTETPPTPRIAHFSAAAACAPGGCAGLCTEDGLARAHREYSRRMFARAVRIVSDPHLAEEAVQEAFVRGWRACATFDPMRGQPGSWLVAITAHVAVDLVRARARRPPVAGGDFAEVADDGWRAGTDRRLEQVLLRAELAGALDVIGADQRVAVVETILRDRSYADVAGELGVPAATIRTRVHYALKRLRAAMIDSTDDVDADLNVDADVAASQAEMTTGMIMGRRRSLLPTHLPTTRRTTCCSS